jgi:transposase
MWTAKNRGRYDRSKLRYPSDLTDEEWTHVEPAIPPAKVGGNRRRVNVSEIVNGIMYVLSTGCQWRAIPKDLPPRSTLFEYLDLWSFDGTLDRMHHTLYVECRKRGDRQASPTAVRWNLDAAPHTSGRLGLRPPYIRICEKTRQNSATPSGFFAPGRCVARLVSQWRDFRPVTTRIGTNDKHDCACTRSLGDNRPLAQPSCPV